MKNVDSQGFQLGVPRASHKMVHVSKHVQKKCNKKPKTKRDHLKEKSLRGFSVE